MPKRPRGQRRPADPDSRTLHQLSRSESIASVIQTLITTAGAVFIARYVYLAVVALAGQNTEASFVLDLLGRTSVNVTLAWALAIGGTGYGYVQKKLRTRTIMKLAPRVKAAEEAIDPERTSSHLTAQGTTAPEDVR